MNSTKHASERWARRDGYDTLASCYRALEWSLFRNQLQRARSALIPDIAACRRVLLLGDGDGRLLAEFLRHHPDASVVSIDRSEKMLEAQGRAVQRLGKLDQVEFKRQDLRTEPIVGGDFDLLITAFFLDCFTAQELVRLLPQWSQSVRVGGQFYFVDFIHPPAGWRRVQSLAYHAVMHAFFRFATDLPNRRLVDLDAILGHLPLRPIAIGDQVHPMMASRLYELPND
ncbi:MAG: class I SAM-dependent methyltransferase [Planctomycetota bacterium]